MIFKNPMEEDEYFNLKEEEGKLYWGDIEVREITEEEKKQSKTNANYVMNISNGNSIFCHLNKDSGTFWKAETVNKDSHEVWLGNKSINYFKDNIVLNLSSGGKVQDSIPFQNEAVMNGMIEKKYSELSNINVNNLNIDKLNDNNISITQPKEEKAGFLKGLQTELRKASENNLGLEAVYGIKDAFNAGMKKNKFLTIGATAGVVGLGLIASGPVAAAVTFSTALTGLAVGGLAAIEGGATTAMYASDYVGKKVKEFIGIPEKKNEPDSQNSIPIKNMFEVKNSIELIRNKALGQPANNENKMKI